MGGSHPSSRRLPWVAASVITLSVFAIAYYVPLFFVLPRSNSPPAAGFDVDWLLFQVSVVVGLVAALLVGYLFRRRFEHPLKGIFLTSAATIFLVVFAIFLVVSAQRANPFLTPNPAFVFVYVFASSAVVGSVSAAVIAAGAAIEKHFQ